jgi:putative endopeptidase
MRRLTVLFLLLLPILASSAVAATIPVASADAESYLAQFVDPSVSPREDFFQFAVGKWLKANPIPASERSWGIFTVIQEETYQRLVALSETAATANAPAGSNAQKIGDFWASGLDTAEIGRQGIAPLAEEFARIEAVRDRAGLLGEVARLHYIGARPMFRLGIFQDEMNSDRQAVHLHQGGLGLPSRDFYVDDDERSRMIRREYVLHLERMFGLLGDEAEAAKAHARSVMELETELARASRKLEDMRDPRANYNAMAVSAVSKLTPSIRWRDLLAQIHIRDVDSVVVGQPEFFQQVEKSLRAHSLGEWKTYLRWHLVDAFAAQAGGRFDAQNFHFYGTILNGVPEQRPRWKRVLDEEEGYLGDALGQLYVERYFSPRTRERYLKLTEDIFAAFRERVGKLDWMTPATKERALRKLGTVVKKVGYPERWRDYSSYAVDRRSFLGNCLRGNIWQMEYAIGKLHKPVDRTEWDMTPQTYNAYYNPSNNEIVLPAAIFILPGIADSLVDDAIVYAYAGGSTIGHELIHGFDDEGRQFDERGNLRDWWTAEDGERFQQRSAGIVRQFNEYVAVGDLHVNGEATQGENIADLAGIELGWDAYVKTDEYRQGRSLGGYTPAQRFFIGWALAWMNQIRPENLALRVKTDVHSPSFLRVTGPVSNLPQFYEAYGVGPGDRMFRAEADRVRIW